MATGQGCPFSHYFTGDSMRTPTERKTRVDPKQFIRVWEMSSGREEAAEKLGMTPSAVSARVSKYRNELAIPLKEMPRKKRDTISREDMLTQLAEIRGVSIAELDR